MSLNKALTFVKEVGRDEEMRNSCYSFSHKNDLLNHLGFTEAEFEDAINMNLVNCQTHAKVEKFQQLKMWFAML
jgi:hypothetical protein